MYVDLDKGGEDVKLQSAIDVVEKSEFSLYQFYTILGKIHDEIIFGNCSDSIEPMDEPDLWADFQIALNTLEIAELQFKKVARAMTLNNK
jgi:hypothetical protein